MVLSSSRAELRALLQEKEECARRLGERCVQPSSNKEKLQTERLTILVVCALIAPFSYYSHLCHELELECELRAEKMKVGIGCRFGPMRWPGEIYGNHV